MSAGAGGNDRARWPDTDDTDGAPEADALVVEDVTGPDTGGSAGTGTTGRGDGGAGTGTTDSEGEGASDTNHPEELIALEDLDLGLLSELGLADWSAESTVPMTEFARVAKERHEYLDALRHLQADFDNFRKRSIRQQTDLVERATERLCAELLPVLDACDLALQHVGTSVDESDSAKALAQIAALLRDTLAREGVERIDAAGVAFDPTVHDAVGHLPAEADRSDEGRAVPGAPGAEAPGAGGAPGRVAASPPQATVAEVLRPGYALKSKVLRPAMVTVRG